MNVLWIIDLAFTFVKIRLNKSILFASKHKIKKIPKLKINYKNKQIKQHSKVTHLGCTLDKTMSPESRALKIINKINPRLKFVHMKNKFLTPALRRLLFHALIQPHFDYGSLAWYPNFSQKMKSKIQITRNKCIRYCLQLGKVTHISKNELKTLNWLPVKDKFNQSKNSIVFKYFTKQCLSYLSDEVFELVWPNNLRTTNSYLKFIYPFRKTNIGQNALSFIGRSMSKKTQSIDTFKHNLKEILSSTT